MNQEELNYLNNLRYILNNGHQRIDRTGVGTLSVFGTNLKFNVSNSFPLLTSKKMHFRGIVEELLFFLRGDTDTKILEFKGVNIWKGNTSREFLDKKGLNYLPEGSLGKGYGYQWRSWGKTDSTPGIDQISNVINSIKNDPFGRRHIVSAWNVSQLHEMALEPCHILFQFYVQENKLSLMWTQRSVDYFLGLPYNIASYATLLHIFANLTNLTPHELIFSGGDSHIYLNHINAVNEQLSKDPYDFPTLSLNKKLSSIDDLMTLSFNDFNLENYQSHSKISAPMAV